MTAPQGMGLTPRARELLCYLSERDVCPTIREMKRAMGYRGDDSIPRLLGQLEERGYIRRRYRQVRGIEVLRPLERPPVMIDGQRYRFIPVHASPSRGSAPVGVAGKSTPAGNPAAGQVAAACRGRG